MSKEIILILVFDFFIFIIPLLLYLYPSKEMNSVFGYRTKRSTKNIENWNFSQRYFSKRWILVSTIVIITQFLLFLFGEIDLKKEPPIIPIVSMVEFFLGSIVCFISTEKQLKKNQLT